MKRRIRTQPTNPFYTNEPAVSRKEIADQSPVPNANLANSMPHGVDKKPGKESGLAGFQSKHRLKAGLSTPTPKLGTASKSPKQGGGLRMSGHPGAHRLGGLKPLKLKV